MATLFLAWQDPARRCWYPIGCLISSDGLYTFAYTKGAEQAQKYAGFQPLASFPDLATAYISDQLFPLFANRLLTKARPEYHEYLEWLNIPESEHDPIAILARSGGRKVTDSLEVFPRPEQTPAGLYLVHFLLHGLRYTPLSSVERVAQLQQGEALLILRDIQNSKDNGALALRTAKTLERDIHIVGYIPRYLSGDILKLIEMDATPEITVARVNPSPAPEQFRILCRATVNWPPGFQPFSGPEFGLISPEAVERARLLQLTPSH